ncbi:pyridoxal-phosphate dependent enzyme [Halomonas sp. A40-4]|uniref:pyridoxal-phosphate dependent enzyme n=1 Tax=Halomonas sp. A40-4 TaxID=2785909 RepID=UPI0018EFBD12|nr:pyridoxal-phosphate dependent enzyme [Halomonas sp. A40-4]QPL47632.1 pyridoxal-phosphate dependent enzyme [Halomonas sp. A40-4]
MTTILQEVIDLIPAAMQCTNEHLIETEVREFEWLKPHCGFPVIAKLENQQITGSFKSRGALFAVAESNNDTVVAASAGNHGLAVAWAGKKFGKKVDIVLPQNASPLKRERILRLGAGVIESGATVDDATESAMDISRTTGAEYVSPYNNKHVIAGQATVIIELLQEINLTHLIIPTGGGGLLCGAIAAKHFLDKGSLHLISCEPQAFNSYKTSKENNGAVKLGRRPTFADGLATNIEPGSITLEIPNQEKNLSFLEVSEEEIASGCAAVFNRESLLAEGAAAAGIAASLKIKDEILKQPESKVGTLLCGGNVHHTTFWHMAAYPFSDITLSDLSDTLGRKAEFEPERRQNISLSNVEKTEDGSFLGCGDNTLPKAFFDQVEQYTNTTDRLLSEFEGFCSSENLLLDRYTLDAVQEVNDLIKNRLQEDLPESTMLKEQRLRALTQLATASRLAFEWRSPSYEQSVSMSAFDLASQGSSGVNYARYDQPGVPNIESTLLNTLGVSPSTHAVLLTNSGMAAFTLAFETSRIFKNIKSVLTAPYLYFENVEMMQYWLGGDNIHVSDSYNADDMTSLNMKLRPDAVLADPLSNHPLQRMVDIDQLAYSLSEAPNQPTLIVDGSMLPLVSAQGVVEAMPESGVYFESCSKYMQFGLDITMAGMVLIPRKMEAVARRVRRNMGLGLDRYGAELFPKFKPEMLEKRIKSMETSALLVAKKLKEFLPEDHFITTFPGLPDHLDHTLSLRYERSGSCVTLAPLNQELNRDQLDPIVDAAIREARSHHVPLVKGVSFGFTASRLSAASALAESAPPFLRLAVGPTSETEAERLAVSLSSAILKVTSRW